MKIFYEIRQNRNIHEDLTEGNCKVCTSSKKKMTYNIKQQEDVKSKEGGTVNKCYLQKTVIIIISCGFEKYMKD